MEISDIKPGTILDTAWGYDCTIYDFCIVLENTGKTLKCAMLGKQNVQELTGGTEVKPGERAKDAPEFRLRISKNTDCDRLCIRGSYPFCNGSTRFGYWGKWDGSNGFETER
jgi:hypothetical protein